VTDTAEAPVPSPADVPEARIRPRRWGLSVAWVVPVVAAIVAGYLIRDHLWQAGPTITVTFTDAEGVKAGTEIRYRGVPIGEVRDIDLNDDHSRVVVRARLRRSAASIARDGSVFWIVRPQVGPTAVRGLATVLTGPYIQVRPGTGKTRTSFTGVDDPSPALGRPGLKIVLAAAHLGSVRNGSPIYYRGIEVGTVLDATLSRDGTRAHVNAFIDQPHARLVRVGSRFWSVSGIDVNVGLLKGVDIRLESLRSLAVGGVAFATPDATAPPARPGTIFVLHPQPADEWLTWTPKIETPAAAAD
jgi:paraquat-inducible protein B